MSEFEVITPHLHGSCVTVSNRVHALFRPAGRKPLFPDLRPHIAPPASDVPVTRAAGAAA